MLTPRQFPYTGPYGLATSGHTSKGPTAEALKRAMSRLGLMEWRDFDSHYNQSLEDALDKFDPGGKNGYGDGRWKKIRGARVPAGLPHAGEYALDRYARTIVQNEAKELAGGSDEEQVQTALREWGLKIIANEPRIGYSQARPGRVSQDPDAAFSSDCSLSIIQGFHYARRKTGLDVPDPAKQGYSGYGNTDWYMEDHPKAFSPFRVGDIGHFHSERHVIMCIKPGTTYTAEWVSHGRAAGPELVRLSAYGRFPEEWMFAVRPPLLAGQEP